MRSLAKLWKRFLILVLFILPCGLHAATIQFSIPYYSVGIIHDIKTGQAIGSGFLLDDIHYTVTAWHVVVDERTKRERKIVFIPVKGVGANETPPPLQVSPYRLYPDSDIAVMRVEGKNFAKESLVRGDTLSLRAGDMIGYGGFDVRKTSPGQTTFTVSGHRITDVLEIGNHRFLEIRGIAIPGFSGGPVFGGGKQVVGIILQGRPRPDVDGRVRFYAATVDRIPMFLSAPK